MERTIIGEFDTRRNAELAVEHVVQECGVPRGKVFIQPIGQANSAGMRAAGADAKAAPELEGHQKLEGALEVSADLHDGEAERIADALRRAGATAVREKQAGVHES